ncbi:DUF5825 family protein [Streptomyces erythrochromogenes]|uniref:DUF5825 family protein n=1 Tax=Streptomyces erythrochromogenes TaxID=285574 RepID=UPI00332D3A62
MITARKPVIDLWRDYREHARTLPGMHLGSVAVADAAVNAAHTARELYRTGVRRAEFSALVDLSATADPLCAVRVLDLLRELTAWGVVVDWRVRLPDAGTCPGGPSAPTLGHLYPPSRIEGPAGAAELRAAWAEGFFLGKCVVRNGPGFLEIRDHRPGVLNRIVIDDPEYLAAVEAVRADPSAAGVDPAVRGDLVAESLLVAVGDLWWWAPHRPHRWPQPPFRV